MARGAIGEIGDEVFCIDDENVLNVEHKGSAREVISEPGFSF